MPLENKENKIIFVTFLLLILGMRRKKLFPRGSLVMPIAIYRRNFEQIGSHLHLCVLLSLQTKKLNY